MENDDTVMVALLPIVSDWANIDFPHLTLVYAGRKSELAPSDIDALGKAAYGIAMLGRTVTLRVLTKDVFGDDTTDNPKVDVVRFHPNADLIRMWNLVNDWDASKFNFNPHLTVGPEGSWNGLLPMMVSFDRVCFCVGDQRQEYHMDYPRDNYV